MKGITVQMIRVSQLDANPYRQIDRYQIDEEKVAALERSYTTSGFWHGSLQVRPHPTKAGRYQIAFGHHRLEAAKRQQVEAIGVVVSQRSDADMLRMMADENRLEFRRDARIAVETIAAVVEAFGRGEIELEAVHPEAPHKVLAGAKTYTLTTVARFLGWLQKDGQPTRACREAFDAYCRREVIGEAVQTLTPDEASAVAVESVVMAARAAHKAAEDAGLPPTKIRQAETLAATEVVKSIKAASGTEATTVAVAIGKAAARVIEAKKKKLPPVEIYIHKLITQCERSEPYYAILVAAERLVPFVDDLDKAQLRQLAGALDTMLARTTNDVRRLVRAFQSGESQRIRTALEGARR